MTSDTGNVSILILTWNEERNLPGCLESVAWSDDVVVLDSGSTDRTEEIARTAGVRLFQRGFDNYAGQRNWALREIRFRHPWIMMLDADERIPPELGEEIRQSATRADPATAAFLVRWKLIFQGRWLRGSSGYPTWGCRLIRPDRVRIERTVHEQFICDGSVERLQGHFHHYPFNKGISYWLERHNRYSTLEAELQARGKERLRPGHLLSRDPVVRRRSWKQLAYRLPARPLLVFLYLAVWRRGLLDGGPGLTYAALRGTYEYMIDVKVREFARQSREEQG